MSEASSRGLVKTCGTCAYRKRAVCLSMKLLQACSRISQDPERVSAVTLATLIREAEELQHRKYKCTREPKAWTHLMDRACAFWQPAEDSTELSSSVLGA